MAKTKAGVVLWGVCLGACQTPADTEALGEGGTGGPEATSQGGRDASDGATNGSEASADGGGSTSTGGGDGTDGGESDGSSDSGSETRSCHSIDSFDDCPRTALDPADPTLQWGIWTGGPIATSPLVANLTDDDGDGVVGLCDTPDVLVAMPSTWVQCATNLVVANPWIVDGATGAVLAQGDTLRFATEIAPAIGDIDGDGIPDIVAVVADSVTCDPWATVSYRLVAFSNTFEFKWQSEPARGLWHVSLADLDNDGDVEILSGSYVYDHTGLAIAVADDFVTHSLAVDLDADGDLEVLVGASAYHHDGTLLFSQSSVPTGIGASVPHVADLDVDGDPEIVIATETGLWVLAHDGTVVLADFDPVGPPEPGWTAWRWDRFAVIADFDGEPGLEIAATPASELGVYRLNGSTAWSVSAGMPSDGRPFVATGAFDFGTDAPVLIAADRKQTRWLAGGGAALSEFPSGNGGTRGAAYPLIADVDGDGAAELLLLGDGTIHPGLGVYESSAEPWPAARRIWNQLSYHVTNVAEDGTIPQFETPHWTTHNAFGMQARVNEGNLCRSGI